MAIKTEAEHTRLRRNALAEQRAARPTEFIIFLSASATTLSAGTQRSFAKEVGSPWKVRRGPAATIANRLSLFARATRLTLVKHHSSWGSREDHTRA